MGWYRVIKTVKGRQYAYLQRSWREGKRVLTESISLGPATSGGASSAPATSAPHMSPQTAHAITTKIGKCAIAAPRGLRFRFDPGDAKVSVARLESDVQKTRAWAVRLGASPDRFPGIVVASGSSLEHRRARFSNDIVVLVPKGERNRATIRREVHRATARAMIDALRTDCPARFTALAGAMDASFRETNRLLFRFLSAQEGASKVVLSLQIYAFGYISPARGRLRGAPETLGISGYGDNARRKSWEAEAVSIMADAQGKGWHKIAETQSKATRNAMRAEKFAVRRHIETRSLFDRFTGKRRLMRRKLAQAVQARQLCEEAERKTALLKSALEVSP